MNKVSIYNNFKLTEVTAQGTNLNKSFELANGEIQKNSNAHMSIGSFRVLEFNNLSQLDNYHKTLKSNQAIIAGVPKYKNMYEGHIVSKGNENPESNVISRTNKGK